MLSTLSSLSLAIVVGLQVVGVVRAWAGVDFFNPIPGGGSMLNKGKFHNFITSILNYDNFSSMIFKS